MNLFVRHSVFHLLIHSLTQSIHSETQTLSQFIQKLTHSVTQSPNHSFTSVKNIHLFTETESVCVQRRCDISNLPFCIHASSIQCYSQVKKATCKRLGCFYNTLCPSVNALLYLSPTQLGYIEHSNIRINYF